MSIGIRNVLLRRCVDLRDFDEAIAFYEGLFGQAVRLRFNYDEVGLKLAQISSVLLIGGADDALAPFRATEATFLVCDLSAAERAVRSSGGQIIRPIRTVPTGRNMLARHPDGMTVEYVQHNVPNPADDVLCPPIRLQSCSLASPGAEDPAI